MMKRRNNSLGVAPLFLFFFSGFLLNGLISFSFFEDRSLILDDISFEPTSFKKTYLHKNKNSRRSRSSPDLKMAADYQKYGENSSTDTGATINPQPSPTPYVGRASPLPSSYDLNWSLEIDTTNSHVVSSYRPRLMRCLIDCAHHTPEVGEQEIYMGIFTDEQDQDRAYARASHPGLQKAADCMASIFRRVNFPPEQGYVFASILVK